jgi:hypothetical protein
MLGEVPSKMKTNDSSNDLRARQDPRFALHRRRVFLGILTALLCASATIGSSDCPPCGPLYCVDTSEYQTALAQKKVALAKHGYPQRLIALFDKLDHCKGCMDTSPDGFSLFTVGNDGSISIKAWTSEDEVTAAKAVAGGTSKSCYVIVSRRACSCCKQPKYSDRPDYDAALDLSKAATVICQTAQ